MNLRIFKFMEIIVNWYTRKSEIWIYKSTQKKIEFNHLLFSNLPHCSKTNIHRVQSSFNFHTRARHSRKRGNIEWKHSLTTHVDENVRVSHGWAQHEPNQLINQPQLQIRSLNWQIISPSALVHSNLAVAHPPPG